jgi:hypothetical protein
MKDLIIQIYIIIYQILNKDKLIMPYIAFQYKSAGIIHWYWRNYKISTLLCQDDEGKVDNILILLPCGVDSEKTGNISP